MHFNISLFLVFLGPVKDAAGAQTVKIRYLVLHLAFYHNCCQFWGSGQYFLRGTFAGVLFIAKFCSVYNSDDNWWV